MSEPAVPGSARELIPRLPRTFRPALNEQLRGWDLLFPAEQRAIKAQLDWLSGLPATDLKNLFARLTTIESNMDLPRWDSHAAAMTVQESGLLARSPQYPQWRTEVESIFDKIQKGVEETSRDNPTPRLLICVLTPVGSSVKEGLWRNLSSQGSWVALDGPFGALLPGLSATLAGRKLTPGLQPIEGTWVIECDSLLAPLAETTPAVVLSWPAMGALRHEFLTRLNTIRRDLKSVDQTNEDLKKLDLEHLLEGPVGKSARVREFLRTLLLSGNGSLVFNNSFVQWGASEALRRVQPQLLLACFGVRPKVKPFSGSVLFENQARANPSPDEDDPAGSVVDAQILSEYVYLASRRVPFYSKKALTIMAAPDLNRVLLLAEAGLLPKRKTFASSDFAAFAGEWLAG